MDCISMYFGIDYVESAASCVLFCEYSCFACILEGSGDRVLDFCDVLCSFDHVDQDISSYIFRTETPNLLSISLIPIEVFA